MTPLIPALSGALLVAGLIGLATGLRPTPAPTHTRPAPPHRLLRWWTRSDPRTRTLLLAGIGGGALAAVLTGWLVAVLLVPAVLAGVPLLLSKPSGIVQIARLEAMAEWTRNLAGVLTVGVGLEQALAATVRSTPDPIRPEVTRLVGRLRARWTTTDAVRAFGDDLDDATGDLITTNLMLAANRRGPGLASVLSALAESVEDDVEARRRVEADRNKPRSSARIVTMISLLAVSGLAFTGSYVQPYTTPVGQVILLALLAAYFGLLVRLRMLGATKPTPRFLTAYRPGRTA